MVASVGAVADVVSVWPFRPGGDADGCGTFGDQFQDRRLVCDRCHVSRQDPVAVPVDRRTRFAVEAHHVRDTDEAGRLSYSRTRGRCSIRVPLVLRRLMSKNCQVRVGSLGNT